MSETTILACRALTNVVVAELPAIGPSYSRVLDDNGMLDLIVPLDDPEVQALGLVSDLAVEPCAVSLFVVRDGTPQWGGLLWGHEWDLATGQLKLTGAEFGSYLSFRYLTGITTTYTGDTATLCSNWIAAAFADGGPPLLTSVAPSGTSTSLAVNSWEQHVILDLVKAFSAARGGFDWAFDVGVSGGNYTAQLTISSPSRGIQTTALSGVVIDVPGELSDLKFAKDGTRFATDVFATGNSTGASQIAAEQAIARPGYLKMQQVVNNPDLTTNAHAQAAALGLLDTMHDGPPKTPVLTMPADMFFSLGVGLGDAVTLAMDTPYLQGPAPVRILGYKVTAQTNSAPELVALTLGSVL